MFPHKNDSPVAVLDAIMAYTEADGSLADIATALHLEPKGFAQLMDWYLNQLPEPERGDRISQNALTHLIIFQMLDVERRKVATLTITVERLEKKIRRLQTPFRG